MRDDESGEDTNSCACGCGTFPRATSRFIFRFLRLGDQGTFHQSRQARAKAGQDQRGLAQIRRDSAGTDGGFDVVLHHRFCDIPDVDARIERAGDAAYPAGDEGPPPGEPPPDYDDLPF